MLDSVVPMRRLALVLAATVMLAACGQRSLPPIGAAPAESAPPITAAATSGLPLFVGRWAVNKAACTGRGWSLTANSLTSPSALSCQFSKADPTSAGYTVYAVCAAGKASQPTRLTFTFSGPASNRGLTLTDGPFTEPVALSRCPADIQAASSAPPAGSSAPA
jgi:hypothetical protein